MEDPQQSSAPPTIKGAIDRLLTTIETIELRQPDNDDESNGIIKPHEHKRIKDAIHLAQQPALRTESAADRRREYYRRFLKRIDDYELIVACALALGQTFIGKMREASRVRLPKEVKKYSKELRSRVIRDITREYTPKGQSSFTRIHLIKKLI